MKKLTSSQNLAMDQNPGTLVNIKEALKIDYIRVATIPKKVAWVLTTATSLAAKHHSFDAKHSSA